MRRFLSPLLVVSLFVAGSLLPVASASAFSLYTQIKTSDLLPIATDKTAVLDVDLDLGDPDFASLVDSLSVSSPGLGSSRIPPVKRYSHEFDPGQPVSEVQI